MPVAIRLQEFPPPLKPQVGGPALLFERLVDMAPRQQSERIPFRTLDRAGLFASIERELNLIFDSRASQTVSDWLAMEKTVLSYGIPDVTHLSPHKTSDINLLKKLLTDSITAFEPRLTNVVLHPLVASQGKFTFQLEADVKIGSMVEPISFPMVFR